MLENVLLILGIIYVIIIGYFGSKWITDAFNNLKIDNDNFKEKLTIMIDNLNSLPYLKILKNKLEEDNISVAFVYKENTNNNADIIISNIDSKNNDRIEIIYYPSQIIYDDIILEPSSYNSNSLFIKFNKDIPNELRQKIINIFK